MSFVSSLFLLALSLHIFEREGEINPSFKLMSTCFWNVIITMSTVGYGDYSAVSNAGRFVAIMISLWGVFFVSLFVVAL